MMKSKSFGERWIKWMNLNFNSGTSSVLLNGTPGRFYTAEGVLNKGILSPPFSLFWLLTCFNHCE